MAFSDTLCTEARPIWGLLEETAAEAGPFERERLREAFLTSSRYEYAFWEMAYRMETWPV